MSPGALDIGDVIERSGVPATTLHVWEQRGLIRPVGRAGLRRQYGPDVLDRLAVIVLCQRSGFSLTEIEALLRPDAFDGGKGPLQAKLDELRRRRDELDAAIETLEHAIECPHEHPMTCPTFRDSLRTVLPRRG